MHVADIDLGFLKHLQKPFSVSLKEGWLISGGCSYHTSRRLDADKLRPDTEPTTRLVSVELFRDKDK